MSDPVITPDAAERRAREIAARDHGAHCRQCAESIDLARDVLSLADALRAAEARAVAAEGERDAAEMQCDDAAHSAEHWRESHDIERAQRDAAVTGHAALAAAVREEREAYHDRFDASTDPRVTPAQRRAYGDRYEQATEATDALLRGAPAGVVGVGVVRGYLTAADAFDAACEAPFAPRSAAEGDARAADAAVVAARIALEAAIAAAGCP